MRTASKVFLIIGIVEDSLIYITLMILLPFLYYGYLHINSPGPFVLIIEIFLFLFLVLAITTGVDALKDLSNYRKYRKKGILAIIFCSPIGGIFCLCRRLPQLKPRNKTIKTK